MRIALYVHDMRASGVVRAMIALARSLAEQGHDAVLIAGSAAGHFTPDDVAPARFVAATGSLPARFARLRVVPPLRRAIRAVRPDVMLSGGNLGHVGLFAASRGLGVPLVFVFSNPMARAAQPLRSGWRRLKARLLIAGSARAVVVGGNVAAERCFAPGLACGKVVLIRNGVARAPARSAPVPTGVPAAMAGPEPVVLAVGRICRQKNYEGLIDAMAHANRVRPLRLVVLGGGDAAYRDALIARAERRGIADRVTFAGVTDDVYAWLRAARVFAMASWFEGSSIALLEAVGAGVPIVASTTAGDAAEVLDGGRYGLLAPPDDPAAFAAALLAQAGDDPVRPGDRIRHYGEAAMMAAYHDLLVTAGRPAR